MPSTCTIYPASYALYHQPCTICLVLYSLYRIPFNIYGLHCHMYLNLTQPGYSLTRTDDESSSQFSICVHIRLGHASIYAEVQQWASTASNSKKIKSPTGQVGSPTGPVGSPTGRVGSLNFLVGSQSLGPKLVQKGLQLVKYRIFPQPHGQL